MNKPIPVVVHTNNEDLFFAMMNAKSRARIAEEAKLEAEAERDTAYLRLLCAKKAMEEKEQKRIQRNLLIFKIVMWGLCTVGCVVSAIECIRSGLWYAAIAPAALIVVSAFNIKK